MEAEKKPKRQMNEIQLENLRKGREKRAELTQKSKEITTYKKQQKQIKNEKRDKDYNALMEMKKKEEAKEEVKEEMRLRSPEAKEEDKLTPLPPKPKLKQKAKQPPPPPPEEDPSEEEEEEEEVVEYEPPPRKTIQQPPPPPKRFVKKQQPIRREPSENELYQNANIEMLRNKFYQQTRQRLMTDLFNY